MPICSIFSGIANVPSNTYKSSSGSLADGIALVLFLARGVNVVGPALDRLTDIGITIAAFFYFV
jgi:hypothetical protein